MDATKPKRGLGALLAATTSAPPPQANASAALPSDAVVTAEVPLAQIRPNPNQPRTQFEPQALADLAASIKAQGLIQPLVVRQLKPEEIQGEAKYELIAGERRWRASQVAQLTKAPVVIKRVFDQRDILLLSLVENLQRDDLNPMEEALAYQRLSQTFHLTHEQIADGVGKNRATVSNAIRLLDLPESIQDAVRHKKLSVGHAKVLLSIPDGKLQNTYASKVQAEQWSVRDLEHTLRENQETPRERSRQGRPSSGLSPHLQEIEARLREYLGTRVTIEEGARRGRIVIEYYSNEDLDRVMRVIGSPKASEIEG